MHAHRPNLGLDLTAVHRRNWHEWANAATLPGPEVGMAPQYTVSGYDWSSAFFPARRLERRLSPSTLKCMWPLSQPTMMQWMAGPWESMISSWGSWRVPGGWTPPGHPLCPLGTSLSSWLDFRGAPLSRWTQSSWNSSLLRQRSWPRSLPSKRLGTSERFR